MWKARLTETPVRDQVSKLANHTLNQPLLSNGVLREGRFRFWVGIDRLSVLNNLDHIPVGFTWLQGLIQVSMKEG